MKDDEGVKLLDCGIKFQNQGNINKAKDSYLRALEMFFENGEDKNIAKTYFQIGNCFYLEGQYQHSLEYYNHAMNYFIKLEDKIGEALSIKQIGCVDLKMSNLDIAKSRLLKAENIFSKNKYIKGVAETNLILCEYYVLSDNLNEAMNRCQKALKLYRDHKIEGIADCFHQLGIIKQLNREYDESLKYLNEAISHYYTDQSYISLANVLQQIGFSHQMLLNYNLALKYYMESLSIKQKQPNELELASILSQIGCLYTDNKDAKEAIKYTLKSLRIRISHQSTDTAIDINCLLKEKKLLGDNIFKNLLESQLNDEEIKKIESLLRVMEIITEES